MTKRSLSIGDQALREDETVTDVSLPDGLDYTEVELVYYREECQEFTEIMLSADKFLRKYFVIPKPEIR